MVTLCALQTVMLDLHLTWNCHDYKHAYRYVHVYNIYIVPQLLMTVRVLKSLIAIGIKVGVVDSTHWWCVGVATYAALHEYVQGGWRES